MEELARRSRERSQLRAYAGPGKISLRDTGNGRKIAVPICRYNTAFMASLYVKTAFDACLVALDILCGKREECGFR